MMKKKIFIKKNENIIFNSNLNLTNHFLISMPYIHNSIFNNSVIYIFKHNKNGTLGIIINKKTDININLILNNKLNNNFQNLNFEKINLINNCVIFGGITQIEKNFILYIKKDKNIIFTNLRNFLKNKLKNSKIKKILISFGYSGWGAGQIEKEIIKEGWLITKANNKIIFDILIKNRYKESLALLNIKKNFLSNICGNA